MLVLQYTKIMMPVPGTIITKHQFSQLVEVRSTFVEYQPAQIPPPFLFLVLKSQRQHFWGNVAEKLSFLDTEERANCNA